jgi:hypothetical protein
MADIAAAIAAKLASVTGVTSLIGRRVYPSYDKQANRTYPLAVYDLHITPVSAFDGPTTMTSAVLEIAAIAKTYGQAVTVGNAIYAALEYQAGTWGTVNVQGCFLQDDGIKDDKITDPTTEDILYYAKVFRFDLTFDN